MKNLTNQQVKETANSVYVLNATILQLEKNLAIKDRKIAKIINNK